VLPSALNTAYAGRSKPGTVVVTVLPVFIRSGDIMVTESESLLKTRSSVPDGFETNVCAAGMGTVAVMPPLLRFSATTPPGGVPVFIGAAGTAT
jgi:hypothetical protein